MTAGWSSRLTRTGSRWCCGCELSKFLSPADSQGDFTLTKQVSGSGPQEVVIQREDFQGPDGKTLQWAKIATFQVTLVDVQGKATLPLGSEEGQAYVQAIRLVD